VKENRMLRSGVGLCLGLNAAVWGPALPVGRCLVWFEGLWPRPAIGRFPPVVPSMRAKSAGWFLMVGWHGSMATRSFGQVIGKGVTWRQRGGSAAAGQESPPFCSGPRACLHLARLALLFAVRPCLTGVRPWRPH